MEVADDLRVGGRQVGVRAVGEGDGRAVGVGRSGRVESEAGQVGDERVEADVSVDATSRRVELRLVEQVRCRGAPLEAADGGRLLRRGTRGGSHAREHRGHQGHCGRLQPERRRIGRDREPVLGPADAAPALGLDDEQSDVAHALQVGAHGVGVEPERLRHVGGRQRAGRPGQLQVDGVAGVVPKRLQQVEARRRPVGSVHVPSLHGGSR